jgi:hypothetical protein
MIFEEWINATKREFSFIMIGYFVVLFLFTWGANKLSKWRERRRKNEHNEN